MRVICINEKWRNDGKVFNFDTPVFGGEYNVINCRYCEYEERFDKKERIVMYAPAGIYYELREFPGFEYKSTSFATLPDQTAEEMREEQREGIVNIETPVV